MCSRTQDPCAARTALADSSSGAVGMEEGGDLDGEVQEDTISFDRPFRL